MRLLRLIPAGGAGAIVALGLVAIPGGCGIGSNPEVQLTPGGLTPKEAEITRQMADFEASQKKGTNRRSK